MDKINSYCSFSLKTSQLINSLNEKNKFIGVQHFYFKTWVEIYSNDDVTTYKNRPWQNYEMHLEVLSLSFRVKLRSLYEFHYHTQFVTPVRSLPLVFLIHTKSIVNVDVNVVDQI